MSLSGHISLCKCVFSVPHWHGQQTVLNSWATAKSWRCVPQKEIHVRTLGEWEASGVANGTRWNAWHATASSGFLQLKVNKTIPLKTTQNCTTRYYKNHKMQCTKIQTHGQCNKMVKSKKRGVWGFVFSGQRGGMLGWTEESLQCWWEAGQQQQEVEAQTAKVKLYINSKQQRAMYRL